MGRKTVLYSTELPLLVTCLALGLSSVVWAADVAGDGQPNAHSVYLRVDGNLSGRVCWMDPTGTARPARVTVTLLQSGVLVASAHCDAWGRFQLVGLSALQDTDRDPAIHRLRPGVYSVVANGAEGFAAFSVRVMPYQKEAPRSQSTLDISLVPVSEKKMLTGLLEARQGQLLCPSPTSTNVNSYRAWSTAWKVERCLRRGGLGAGLSGALLAGVDAGSDGSGDGASTEFTL